MIRLRELVAQADDDDPLTALLALARARAELERAQEVVVRRARLQGASWSVIAMALGVSRQAAHKRFGLGWGDR